MGRGGGLARDEFEEPWSAGALASVAQAEAAGLYRLAEVVGVGATPEQPPTPGRHDTPVSKGDCASAAALPLAAMTVCCPLSIGPAGPTG